MDWIPHLDHIARKAVNDLPLTQGIYIDQKYRYPDLLFDLAAQLIAHTVFRALQDAL
jgi:hypothetical protein